MEREEGGVILLREMQMTERPEGAPDTIYARIEALEKRVEALERHLGVGKPCLFETRRDPHYASHSVAYCVVHHSYDCQPNTDQ